MQNKVFIDTSGWAELFVATESYHQKAKEWFTKARKQQLEMVTSNYVVAELVALLNSPLRSQFQNTHHLLTVRLSSTKS